MDSIEEGATKNICVIIIRTNSKWHDEEIEGLNAKKRILVQLYLRVVTTEIQSSTVVKQRNVQL